MTRIRSLPTLAVRSGISLVETILAVVLLGLFAVGVGSSLGNQTIRTNETLTRQSANNIARTYTERIRAAGPLAYNYSRNMGSLEASGDSARTQTAFFRDYFYTDVAALSNTPTKDDAHPYRVVLEGHVSCDGGPLTDESPASLAMWGPYNTATNTITPCAVRKPVVTYDVLVDAPSRLASASSSSAGITAVGMNAQFVEQDLLNASCAGGQLWDNSSQNCVCPSGQFNVGGICSCPASTVWNGSSCVTPTCTAQSNRDSVTNPFPSIGAATSSSPIGAHWYQQPRADWCNDGDATPSANDWGRYAGTVFQSGVLIPVASSYTSYTGHIGASYVNYNYACGTGGGFNSSLGICSCSQVTPAGGPATGTWSFATGPSGTWTATVVADSVRSCAAGYSGTESTPATYTSSCVAAGSGFAVSASPSISLGSWNQAGCAFIPLSCSASGPDSEPCTGARIGTATRVCNTTTGNYGSWNESACAPAPIACSGPTSQACGTGRSGTSIRTCDTATGTWSAWDEAGCTVDPIACSGAATQACSGGQTGTSIRTCNTTNGTWSAWDDAACACPAGMSWTGSICECAGSSSDIETRTCVNGTGTETRDRIRTCGSAGWDAWSTWSIWNTSTCVLGSVNACVLADVNTTTETEACPSGSQEATRTRTMTSTCSGAPTAWSSPAAGGWSSCTPIIQSCADYFGNYGVLFYGEACAITWCSVQPNYAPGNMTIICDGMGCTTTWPPIISYTTTTTKDWNEGPLPAGPFSPRNSVTSVTTTMATPCPGVPIIPPQQPSASPVCLATLGDAGYNGGNQMILTGVVAAGNCEVSGWGSGGSGPCLSVDEGNYQCVQTLPSEHNRWDVQSPQWSSSCSGVFFFWQANLSSFPGC